MQKGASRLLSRTKIAFTCIPWGDVQNTGLSRPVRHMHLCMNTHALTYAETHTLFISFMPDYNRIILTRTIRSQTYTIILGTLDSAEKNNYKHIHLWTLFLFLLEFVCLCVQRCLSACIREHVLECMCKIMHIHPSLCVHVKESDSDCSLKSAFS